MEHSMEHSMAPVGGLADRRRVEFDVLGQRQQPLQLQLSRLQRAALLAHPHLRLLELRAHQRDIVTQRHHVRAKSAVGLTVSVHHRGHPQLDFALDECHVALLLLSELTQPGLQPVIDCRRSLPSCVGGGHLGDGEP